MGLKYQLGTDEHLVYDNTVIKGREHQGVLALRHDDWDVCLHNGKVADHVLLPLFTAPFCVEGAGDRCTSIQRDGESLLRIDGMCGQDMNLDVRHLSRSIVMLEFVGEIAITRQRHGTNAGAKAKDGIQDGCSREAGSIVAGTIESGDGRLIGQQGFTHLHVRDRL